MRNERFFGLHFDFHAGKEHEIGCRTDPADIAWYINEAQPDFIQCDCKGHPGLCSYPTKVGNPAPKLQKDNLRIWADTVHGMGLPLYVHYSGVWDDEYTRLHPEHAVVHADGEVTGQASLFGPYVDDLLIPQMKELITEYGIDGCWIDGECWAVNRDYSPLAQPHLWEGMTKSEHNRVMRQAFLRYVQHYTDEIHKFAPHFRIASNWLYSEQVPEKPEIGVDFISGDFEPNDSTHVARYNARCMALQGKPWDLMVWSFGFDGLSYMCKPTQQMQQEAAVVMSQGGGFQIYVMQNRDGSARREHSSRFREVGEFVRQRRVNFQKPPVAQIGIFNAVESRYEETAEHQNIFNPPHAHDLLKGTLHSILDSQYTANVVLEHAADTIGQYEVMVVPAWKYLSRELKEKLLAYANGGGKLVVMGADLCAEFGDLMGISFGRIQRKTAKGLISKGGYFASYVGDYLDLKTGEGHIYSNMDDRDTELPGWRTKGWGSGSITFIPFDLGGMYLNSRSLFLTDHLCRVLDSICTPLVQCNKKNVDLVLQKDGDGLLLNLINMNQSRHSLDYYVYEEVPALENVEVRIRRVCNKVSMPLGEHFRWEIQGEETVIAIDRLHIHSIMELQ